MKKSGSDFIYKYINKPVMERSLMSLFPVVQTPFASVEGEKP